MILLMYLALAMAAAGAIGGEIFLRKLIDFEYIHARNSWLTDGKPPGGRDSRQEASFWLSGLSRFGVGYDWLLATPAWAEENTEAKSLLKRYRLWSGVFAVGLASLVTIAFTG